MNNKRNIKECDPDCCICGESGHLYGVVSIATEGLMAQEKRYECRLCCASWHVIVTCRGAALTTDDSRTKAFGGGS